MTCLVVVLLLLFAARIVLSAECSYEGNICDADAQCMGEVTDGYLCLDMDHEKLYKSSSPRKFSVYISDMTSYPDDVTVTVLRVYGDEYTTVPGCCDLKSNDSCMLPPSDEADYIIVAPSLEVEDDFLLSPSFCSFLVADMDETLLKWCHINKTAPCKYVKGDAVLVNVTFMDLSTSLQKNLTYDLCLFDAPIMKADGLRYFHDDGLSYDVRNVEVNPDEMCSGVGNGKIIKYLNRLGYLDAFMERAPPGYTRCGFEKEIGYSVSPSWSLRPNCHAHGTHERFPVWSIIIVVVLIALILVFILTVVYRRYADSWFPEYKIPLQLTEVLSNNAEKEKEKRTRKDAEIVVNGISQEVAVPTSERYSRTPVRLAKFAYQRCSDNEKLIDTELILPQNGDSDEIIGAGKTPNNILQNSDEYSEKNMAVSEDGNQIANFGYVPKHHDSENSFTTEENVKISDLNGNNILSNPLNVDHKLKEEILNNAVDVGFENTASQSCSSIDSADINMNINATKIIYTELYKKVPIYSIEDENIFKERVYVRKYD